MTAAHFGPLLFWNYFIPLYAAALTTFDGGSNTDEPKQVTRWV